MWMIPVQGRRGCGYVYDSNFTSDEEAKAEIETQLGHEIEPIKIIKFDTGRQRELWKKNCLFIGLSAAFAEPLEATSIHSTIMQLNSFVFHYLKDTKEDTCNSGSINRYNRKMALMYDDFKDFLSIHYASQRTDSEFWKAMNAGEYLSPMAKDLIEMQRSKIVTQNDLDQYFGYAGAALYNWVLIGLGYIGKKEAVRELDFYSQHEIAKTVWDLHANSRAHLSEIMIDNTQFVNKIKEYADGNYFSE
jgi:tryptophan halogenase